MIDLIDHGPVRELRLNRPPANALGPDLVAGLLRALEASPEQGIRAVILSGAPGMFSAGLDIPLLLKQDRHAIATFWREFYKLMETMAASPFPIAAAITGHAPAGGTVLALFCDWRVVAEGNWKIGLNEVQVGLPLPPLIYSALRRVVGTRRAENLGVRGLLINPSEALNVGLVDELAAPDQVVSRALDWCRNVLSLPHVSMTATRNKARADLAALFQGIESEIESISNAWWDAETQATLRRMVERLATKKK